MKKRGYTHILKDFGPLEARHESAKHTRPPRSLRRLIIFSASFVRIVSVSVLSIFGHISRDVLILFVLVPDK